MSKANSINDANIRLIKVGNTNGGIILNDPETIIRDEYEVDKEPCGAKHKPININSDSNCLPCDLNSEKNHIDLQGNKQEHLDSSGTELILRNETVESCSPVSENKSNGVDHMLNMDELRKISSEIVSEVLVKAENHLMDTPHQEPEPESNCNAPNSGSNGYLNSEMNYEPQAKNETKPKEITDSDIHGKELQLREVLDKMYNPEDFTKKIEFEMNKFDPKYDVDPDTVCGIGCFRPRWLQPWATVRVYLVLYCIIGILSGSYYSYLIGSMSTLEKRFSFKSKISGLIMTVDEITPLFLGVLVGYFGGRAHRPRVVAFGMLMSSICCFVSALPYFVYGPATHLSLKSFQNDTGHELCDGDVVEENCDSDVRPPTLAPILLLMFGSFLKGFGNLAYYAVGLAYMDDNSKQKNTPMYLAFAFALRLLGPLLGFLMSSVFLKYPEDPFGDPGFGNDDPRWIGGWWMGFLVQGVLLLMCTVPMSLFPRRLPGHKELKPSTLQTDGKKLESKVGSLFGAIKRLGKNPLFIFITLNSILSTLGTFGHFIMLPKYMENQFKLSASEASLASGPPGIAAAITSILVGGYLIYRLRPSPKVLTAGMVSLEVITAIGFLMLMIPSCEVTEMSNFGLNNDGLMLDGECNANCNCSTSKFTPVCSSEGNTLYFSPCYAGCKLAGNQEYSNCSCATDTVDLQYVTEGFCVSKDCWPQALTYIISFPLLQGTVSLLRAAYTMILLRSIDPQDKSVALGIFETLISAFGFIPFPIVFGSLVDSACLVWETSCGQTGNCWLYDVSKFNYLLHGASALFSSLSATCLFVIYLLSSRLRNLYEDFEDPKTETNKKDKERELSEETDVVTKF